MVFLGLVITGVSGAAIAVIGLSYLLAPRTAASWFGLPVVPPPEATPWLRVKGVRDLACGVVAAVMLLTVSHHAIGWLLLAFALIPLGDAVIVVRSRGSVARALGVHVVTAAFMIAGTLLLIGA